MVLDYFKLALLGHPLGHSRSPEMHQRALAHCKLQGSYELIDVPESQLADTVLRLKDDGYAGFNVTIPYKEKIISLLDDLDDKALMIGAVNTVKIDATTKRATGYNTDADGIAHTVLYLFDPRIYGDISDSTVTVLGSGGAARAAVAVLSLLGFKQIYICARNEEKANRIVADFTPLQSEGTSVQVLAHGAWRHAPGPVPDPVPNPVPDPVPGPVPNPVPNPDHEFNRVRLFINTTPLGQASSDSSNQKDPKFFDEMVSQLPDDALVFDLVYASNNESATPFVEAALKRGLKACDGRLMLATQAATAFKIWTDEFVLPEIMLGRD